MEVLLLRNKTFYTLIEEVVDRIKEKNDLRDDKWIDTEETYCLLQTLFNSLYSA